VRILIRVVVVVLVLAGGLWGAGRWWSSRAQAVSDAPTVVRAEPAARGSLVEFISAAGEIQPRARVSISARVSARIAKLPFKEGDAVIKGNPNANPPVPPSMLVKLDSKDLEAQLRSVEARRAAEQASLEVSRTRVAVQNAQIDALKVMLADAKRELKRKSELLANKDVSQSEVDQLQAKVDQQEAQLLGAVATLKAEEGGLIVLKHNIEAAEAEIAKARDNLTYATITSPIDGVVTRLNAEVGEVVVTGTMNNAGTMIMEVADLSQMMLEAKVDETSIAEVHVGQKAKVRMEAFRDQVFDGVVHSVALANFDPQFARGSGSNSRSMGPDSGKSYRVDIQVDMKNARKLSGLSADADIETRRYEDVVKVPSQSVLGRSPDSLPEAARKRPEVDTTKSTVPVVFRLVDDKAVATPVAIGASDFTHTVIKSGLSAGDLVITGPYKVLESLKDGQKLKRDGDATTKPTTTSTTTEAAATQRVADASPATRPTTAPTSQPALSTPR
jgi:HlyD family secretion protein